MQTTTLTIPTSLILEYILPLLDRITWNNLCCANKELYLASQSLRRPWPQTYLPLSSATRTDHDSVTCVAFSPDGNFLVCGTRKGGILLWDNRTGTVENLTDPSIFLYTHCVCFSSTIPSSLSSLSSSSSSSSLYLAAGVSCGTYYTVDSYNLFVWDLGCIDDDDDEIRMEYVEGRQHHWDVIRQIAFSPNNNNNQCSILASCSEDRTIRFWSNGSHSNSTWTCIYNINDPDDVLSIAFGPPYGTIFAATNHNIITLYEIAYQHRNNKNNSSNNNENNDGQAGGSVLIGTRIGASVGEEKTTSNDNDTNNNLATSNNNNAGRPTIQLDVKMLRTITFTHWLGRVVFSNDGNYLAFITHHNNGVIQVWKKNHTISGKCNFAFFKGFSCAEEEQEHDQDMEDEEAEEEIRIDDLTFSPDGKNIAFCAHHRRRISEGSYGRIKEVDMLHTWNMCDDEKNKDKIPLPSNDANPRSILLSIDFSADGRTIATGCKDKTVRLWDVCA